MPIKLTGTDIEMVMLVTIEDAVKGFTKRIKLNRALM